LKIGQHSDKAYKNCANFGGHPVDIQGIQAQNSDYTIKIE